MYTIKTLNAISPVGLAKLNNKQFDVAVDTDTPDGILVRSADMLNTAFNDNLLAIARAGAGVNNIPLDRCSEQGIVVFNTPGANANAVAELVIGMLIAGSRNVAAAAQWCQGLTGDPAMAKTVEKGKKQFVGNDIVDEAVEVGDACGLELCLILDVVHLLEDILEGVVVLLGDGILCAEPQILLHIQCVVETAAGKAADGIILVVLALQNASALKVKDGGALLRAIGTGEHQFSLACTRDAELSASSKTMICLSSRFARIL